MLWTFQKPHEVQLIVSESISSGPGFQSYFRKLSIRIFIKILSSCEYGICMYVSLCACTYVFFMFLHLYNCTALFQDSRFWMSGVFVFCDISCFFSSLLFHCCCYFCFYLFPRLPYRIHIYAFICLFVSFSPFQGCIY